MTHAELDELGPKLQQKCNDEIKKRFPSWSRYATDQMIDDTMRELAPDWSWMLLRTMNGVPEIMLTQYTGEVG